MMAVAIMPSSITAALDHLPTRWRAMGLLPFMTRAFLRSGRRPGRQRVHQRFLGARDATPTWIWVVP